MLSNMSDYHIHTHFSGDSEADFDEIATSAIEKGLKSICITDHNDFDFWAEDILFELNIEEYFDVITKFKEKYNGKLDIRLGVEIGLEPDKADRIRDFVNSKPFDFVIGSSHIVNGFDPYYPEYFENKTDYEAFFEYFKSVKTNLNYCSDFDVYGHIDYVVRYSPNKDKNYKYLDYKDIIDEILTTLINNNKGIEVNTSAYRSGLKNPNPCIDIIKRYKELGGEIITIGSDAHKPVDVGYRIGDTLNLIKECGFDYYSEFKNRIPEYIKL